jgi:hypothetical protein
MMKGSRRLALAATSVLVAGLVACSTVQVSTDYDPAANFSQYKTFSFMPMGKIDSITAGRIETAITLALQARGLQKAPATGDLQISVRARRSHEKVITSVGYGGYGWGRGWRGGMGTTTVQNVPVGTLVVDLVDASANKLVWQGMATDTIDPSSTGREKQDELNSAMAKLFAGYPPTPGQ